MKKIMIMIVLGILGFTFHSCQKEKEMSHVQINLTDAPGNYDAVLVDIQAVEVISSGSGTVMLNTTAGIYNLLDFANGLDTLIATADLEAGTLSQIRLILGTNNSVMVDSVSYPLATPSAQQSGLKLQVHHELEQGVTYAFTLDFDANESIVVEGNGSYSLKPVIRTIDQAVSGSIHGSTSLLVAGIAITATSNGVSYSSVTDANGNFIIAGLPAGTYDITLTPAPPLTPVTITGIVVNVGTSTDVGIVTI